MIFLYFFKEKKRRRREKMGFEGESEREMLFLMQRKPIFRLRRQYYCVRDKHESHDEILQASVHKFFESA